MVSLTMAALLVVLNVLRVSAMVEPDISSEMVPRDGPSLMRWHIMMVRQGSKMEAASVPPTQKMAEGQDDMEPLDIAAIMTECNETFRIEMEFLASLNESGSFPDETDNTPKCYMRCVLERLGVASPAGELNAARAADVFAGTRGGRTMTDLREMAAACALRGETCKCERSYNFMKCLMEAEIEKYEDGRE